jgi:hypothetical protein
MTSMMQPRRGPGHVHLENIRARTFSRLSGML